MMATETLRQSLDKLGNELMRDFLRDMHKVEADRVKAKPSENRLTTIFDKPLSYRYYRKGRMRFCYSVHRNVAGYFLIWRERIVKHEDRRYWERDQWDSTKDKRDAIATCRERAKG